MLPVWGLGSAPLDSMANWGSVLEWPCRAQGGGAGDNQYNVILGVIYLSMVHVYCPTIGQFILQGEISVLGPFELNCL